MVITAPRVTRRAFKSLREGWLKRPSLRLRQVPPVRVMRR